MTTDDSINRRNKWALIHEKDKGRRVMAVCIVLTVVIAAVLIYSLVW